MPSDARVGGRAEYRLLLRTDNADMRLTRRAAEVRPRGGAERALSCMDAPGDWAGAGRGWVGEEQRELL